MGRNAVDLQEDERLAQTIYQFPCLWQKESKAYKDNRAKGNAWKKVEEDLGMEEGNSI